MPDTFAGWVGVIQLLVNVGALIGAAAVWRLYVAKLKADLGVKDSTITSVEKNRDFWKDKAQELEKRSPEFMEGILEGRIQTREAEIVRLDQDRELNQEAIRLLSEEKVVLESTLEKAKGFAAMLELEGEDDYGSLGDLEVVKLGEVGVDSGQLMVTDPCYINSEWSDEPFEDVRIYDDSETGTTVQYGKDFQHYEQILDSLGHTANELIAAGRLVLREEKMAAPFRYSYRGACDATNSQGYGELAYSLGHAGAGVVFSTAFGDGAYPIYGEKRGGRIVRVYVNVA